ncbi:M17 family metallopeptidase [Mycoplasma struthionis]|uniref:Probable cytosol aminopeptidase n=1 Tax=Mycoplasma struthionis TaxID=538220 RepID=A0A3G8LGS9_9MOLU|nr:leucyl aminopeptidase family protein [Mycoplasma struthionis]AZG68497.1 leucyl aminopeptidase family protein [Mycoplasma struthionis]
MFSNYEQKRNDEMLMRAAYEGSQFCSCVAQKDYHITENLDKNTAYIFIPKDVENYYDFLKVVDKVLLSKRRNIQIDIASFVKEGVVSIEEVFRAFVMRSAFHNAKLYSAKESDKKPKKDNKEPEVSLYYEGKEYLTFVKELLIIADAINSARDLQITPPNIATSEYIAKFVKKDLGDVDNLTVNVLTKTQIEELNMNLLLAVNSGSSYQPRVVVVNYKGNPSSKEKYVFVGKGITFDTGGYNTKGYHMDGMKFDMSGSVICAYAVKAIAQLKLKANVSAVMMLTDNAIDNKPTMPESVVTSMSGKTVEITDTDAEGRLVLADGLFYGAKNLKASLLVDVATLTGSMISALGKTFSGIYSTSDSRWDEFSSAASVAHEKVWRMPMHEDYHKPNLSTKVADLNNYSTSEKSDSNTAAMFLKEFSNGVDLIHCDVAGTADNNGMGLGVLVSTLVELAKGQK